MRISDWSSDVCSSDLPNNRCRRCFQRAALLIFADIEAFRIDELDVAQADEVEEGRHERCLRVRRRVLVETAARCKHVNLAIRQQAFGAVRGIAEGDAGPGEMIEEIGRASCRERVCQYG